MRGAEGLGLLLEDCEADTLALGEGDQGLVALADDEDVGEAGGELVAGGVPNVDDVEASLVLLLVDDHAHAPGIVSAGHDAQVADVELDEIGRLAGLNVQHDRVVDLHSFQPEVSL